ncbi:unnamed protein product [Dovyalis caffra]|uniref:Recombination activating protein 1 n=1 Tax=Dovyalis caffra TaxID=77055 RepID=A0AAV1SKJ1_9ROSI|nr:unnamed protein product [Dovyalis caffra]
MEERGEKGKNKEGKKKVVLGKPYKEIKGRSKTLCTNMHARRNDPIPHGIYGLDVRETSCKISHAIQTRKNPRHTHGEAEAQRYSAKDEATEGRVATRKQLRRRDSNSISLERWKMYFALDKPLVGTVLYMTNSEDHLQYYPSGGCKFLCFRIVNGLLCPICKKLATSPLVMRS